MRVWHYKADGHCDRPHHAGLAAVAELVRERGGRRMRRPKRRSITQPHRGRWWHAWRAYHLINSPLGDAVTAFVELADGLAVAL